MPLETIKTILTLGSGLCWTLVYIEGIRLGITDRSYAIPFYALVLNLAWELLHAYLGLRATIDFKTITNAVWFLFDLGILSTYFRYGKKYFPANLVSWFVPWSILGLFTAFWVEYAFVREFGTFAGGAYAAFLQNLLMSVLFIGMHPGAKDHVWNDRRRHFLRAELFHPGSRDSLLSFRSDLYLDAFSMWQATESHLTFNDAVPTRNALERQTFNQRVPVQVCGESLMLRSSSILSPANASESRGDRAADREWHKRRPRRLPPHNRCRMGIASTASDGIKSRMDEHRQKELASQDRKGLSQESNRQLRLRTIHRIVHPTRGLLPRPRVLRRSSFSAS